MLTVDLYFLKRNNITDLSMNKQFYLEEYEDGKGKSEEREAGRKVREEGRGERDGGRQKIGRDSKWGGHRARK